MHLFLFFDLGSTLIHAKESWSPILRRADGELVRYLRQAGFPVKSTTLRKGCDTFMDAYYAQREKGDHLEPTTFVFLREIMAEAGFGSIPDPILRRALGSMYAVIERNWFVEEDAIPTLARLREEGYPLGLISNASDDNNVQALVDQCGFRPFFDLILTSASCGFRKPHPRIFQIALEHFGIQAGQAAMIGDMLEADIAGANNLGIYSIWVTQRASAEPNFFTSLQQAHATYPGQAQDIRPKAIIQTLGELSALLAGQCQPSP